MVNNSLIKKLKKLLALATSPNENEAAVAAEKASLLLAQYNLSLADLGPSEPESICESRVEKTPRYVTWKMILLSGIAEANGCHAMRSNSTGMMLLVGTPTNLLVCQHLYEYLTQAIERQAKCCKGNGWGLAYLNAFRVGCATRLSQRLIAQKEAIEDSGIPGSGETPATPAIVVRSMFEKNQREIDEYLQKHGFKVKIRSTVRIQSESGFQIGYQVGDRISLSKQVQSQSSLKLLQEG